MLSSKLGLAIALLMMFLVIVAFIMGRPDYRDARVYPIIKEYEPFIIKNSFTGLKIYRKDNPSFKEEPDAKNFYPRLKELERTWAKEHLKLDGKRLIILDKNGTKIKEIELKNQKELNFIINYYGVKVK